MHPAIPTVKPFCITKTLSTFLQEIMYLNAVLEFYKWLQNYLQYSCPVVTAGLYCWLFYFQRLRQET